MIRLPASGSLLADDEQGNVGLTGEGGGAVGPFVRRHAPEEYEIVAAGPNREPVRVDAVVNDLRDVQRARGGCLVVRDRNQRDAGVDQSKVAVSPFVERSVMRHSHTHVRHLQRVERTHAGVVMNDVDAMQRVVRDQDVPTFNRNVADVVGLR